jgi:hypothetical protein
VTNYVVCPTKLDSRGKGVSAGGLSRDGQHWLAPKNPAFLVPCFALSKIFRGKFRAGLKKLGLLEQVAPSAWKEKWVVH